MNNRLLIKIKNRLLNFLLPIYYKLVPSKIGINIEEKREKKVIVSLTSIPNRFDKLNLCLESLLRQTYKPDKIILYLGNDKCSYEDIPLKIIELKKKGIEIEFRKDLKPHTKYFYSMQEFSRDIIITVDDDIYYSSKLIKKLMSSYKKYPESISCMRAHKITFNDANEVNSYNDWDGEHEHILEPTFQLLATGVGGVLYPPNCMGNEVFNEENIRAMCLKADDIWLKFMQILNKTKVVIADEKNTGIVVIKDTQEIALHKSNVTLNQNDLYIKSLTEYYKVDLHKIIKE